MVHHHPHCAVVDEYHEHATDALYTTMLVPGWGATSATDSLLLPGTTLRAVLRSSGGSWSRCSTVRYPTMNCSGIIHTVDEGDDWTDPQVVLEKLTRILARVGLSRIFVSQQQRAKITPVWQTSLNKTPSIVVSARSAYFQPRVSWQSCK